MSNITPHPGDALIEKIAAMQADLEATTFPELVEEEVTDDGETYMALRCPRCGLTVEAEDLNAVDVSERWSEADDTYSDEVFDRCTITFTRGDNAYGETLYYLHTGHAVSLPDGWKESWA